MKTRSWLMVLVAGMMLLTSVKVFAAGPKEMGHMREARGEKGGKEYIGKVFDSLGISAEQKAKLEAGRVKNRDAAKGAREEMRATRELLAQELDKPTLDMTKVKALHEKLKGSIIIGEDRRLEMILEVRSILTPEQFTAFQKQMKEMHPKMHREGKKERKGHGKGFGQEAGQESEVEMGQGK